MTGWKIRPRPKTVILSIEIKSNHFFGLPGGRKFAGSGNL